MHQFELPSRNERSDGSIGDVVSRRTAGCGARVMLIDDDSEICEALTDLLADVGYVPVAYDQAQHALAALERDRLPDVIVLDLMMPGMNGWQFRLEQKRRESLRRVPVVVLSADMSPHAQAIDAAAFVAKPVAFDRLQGVIEGVLRDQQQLAASEGMQALGLSMAGLAHEINNPLSTVLGSLQLARRDADSCVGGDSQTRDLVHGLSEHLALAEDGALHIAAIVNLLSGRADAPRVKSIKVVRAVRTAIRLAQHRIPPHACLHAELRLVPNVIGDESRLVQVILNLLINAAQAVDRAGTQDEISVTTSLTSDGVVVEVRDTGPGIAPEVCHRIFTPLYTTKPAGSGLGLSLSRENIAAMGGTLTVRSEPGRGAAFRVTLPVSG